MAKQRSIRFNEVLEEQLDSEASALGLSFTDVVQRACDHWLDFRNGRSNAAFEELRPIWARFAYLENNALEAGISVNFALEGAQAGFRQQQQIFIYLLRHVSALALNGITESDRESIAEIIRWTNDLEDSLRRTSPVSDN